MSYRAASTTAYIASAVLVSALTLLAVGVALVDTTTVPLHIGTAVTIAAVPTLAAVGWNLAAHRARIAATRAATDAYRQAHRDFLSDTLTTRGEDRTVTPLRGRDTDVRSNTK